MIAQYGYSQQGTIHTFGEKSKAAIWIVSHILLVLGGILCFLSVFLVFTGERKLLIFIIIAISLFVPVLCFRLFWGDRCYRVEVDTATENIRFFRFFNTKDIEAPIRSVEFVFTWKMTATYSGVKVSIFNEDMARIADILPEGVEIKFSKGIYGRFMKKQYQNMRKYFRDAR